MLMTLKSKLQHRFKGKLPCNTSTLGKQKVYPSGSFPSPALLISCAKSYEWGKGTLLCVVGHLVASLAPPTRCQQHLLPIMTPKNASRAVKCPLGGKKITPFIRKPLPRYRLYTYMQMYSSQKAKHIQVLQLFQVRTLHLQMKTLPLFLVSSQDRTPGIQEQPSSIHPAKMQKPKGRALVI